MLIYDTRLITAKEGCELFGCGLTSWYNLVKNDPSFPKPIRFSPGMVRCRVCQLSEYINRKADDVRELV